MECPRCHQKNDPQASFCRDCAAPLQPACLNCGGLLPRSARFCSQCGRQVTNVAVAPHIGQPDSYVPKYLIEKILTSRSALEGERKQVTVLFADMKGSMELLADRDPEEARKILDPVLERMMEAVHRYEGTVNQVMGDGIMGLFGAPLAHEDHAVRACYAAFRIREAIARYGEEIQRQGDPPVQIRVGLNSGEVVVRSIGTDLRMDYTAVGQTAHLAGRMEQIARPGSILLTRETLRLVEGYVHVKSLGSVPVKGLDAPVEIYELTGVGVAHSRLQAAAARGLTRFVGRHDELRYLHRAMDQVQARQGQVVAIVGEAGVGKSRLFWEFTRSHRTQGWRIIESASISYGKAASYFPIIELLKRYFQIEAGDGPRRIRERVTGMVLSLDRTLEPSLCALLSLLDVPADDPSWEQLDPQQRRQRTLDGVKRLLFRESEVQPIVLVFEDLNWIDAETHTLLDRLVHSLPDSRMLLLVSYRPEFRHTWGHKSHYSQLRLSPFGPDTAAELLEALLGHDPSLDPVRKLLIARTEGNPLFLEESVRTLVETRALEGTRGAYRLVKSVETIRVPPTVQAILASRIDRLPATDKHLLQAAAVIGKDIPFDLLRAIASESEDNLHRGLARLQAAELVYESRIFPDLEYSFKHALTHEVAYASLLFDRRVGLHAQIVDAVETLYRDRLNEHVELLAHHSAEGQLWDKALGYLRHAGVKAFSRAANREAVSFFERALQVLSRLPGTRERTEQAIDLRFDLRSALLPLAEFSRILDYLREAEALATELGDRRRAGLLSVYMTGHSYLLGNYDHALQFGDRALSAAAMLDDFNLGVAANAYQGQVYYVLGDFRRAAALFRRNLDALVGDRLYERCDLPQLPSVHSRACLGWCLAELGDFPEAISVVQEALRIADALDHPLNVTVACSGVGAVLLQQGDAEAAIPFFERGIDLIQRRSVPLWFPRLAAGLGASYTLVGQTADALSILEQAMRRAESMRLVVGHSQLLTHLSEAHLHAGHLTTAREVASRALQLAREHGERGYEAWALRLCGEITMRLDPVIPDSARQYFEDAIRLAEALEMRPLIGRAQLGLARLERQLGLPCAPDRFAAAVALFRELGMARWLREGAEALARLR
jgi:class 3 adenylate cyclase/tetratricopeptide (TPR) repeat protein